MYFKNVGQLHLIWLQEPKKKQLKNMSWSIESIFLIDLLFSLRHIHGLSHMQDGPVYIYKLHV